MPFFLRDSFFLGFCREAKAEVQFWKPLFGEEASVAKWNESLLLEGQIDSVRQVSGDIPGEIAQ